ncbi:kinase-like protein [Athelia psychrophila]|uniref:Kinase-like protein n=1 Tax=Athelia psychrophila TaxID=1759441 RepID=A0A166WZ36_9AGAM|nr:kinase-like protein [Fibularhizoctonia sp. CBS 109695]
MLQYPVPLPPLNLSTSRKYKERSGIRSNDASHHTPPTVPSPLVHRRPNTDVSSFFSRSAFTSPAAHSPHAFQPSQLPFINSPSISPLSSPLLTSGHLALSASPRPVRSKLPGSHHASSSRRSSTASSLMGDVLSAGDLVGQGVSLQGDIIRLVSMPGDVQCDFWTQEFEVVRRLGTGSYAVVYLVREVLNRPAHSQDGHISLDGFELDDGVSGRSSIEYGREFAIKCLSKANLDEEALVAQKAEVTIHQSLRSHPNIATLHCTLETSAFLLLLLEYVPGEDLFYFLEQARDHYDHSVSGDLAISSRTPPTPSLLSNLHPAQLLSRNRLRLIASMFSQMCEAVATCHDQQIFHRDIKPENFIVTDGCTTSSDGRRERKVVVKLTDFGLSTTDLESSDMDCGSAPYMSYECRNNVAPTYKPRAADVWSLGIVLINMLYHFNPWQDTADRVCSSFDLYKLQPVEFFMQRFTGMTRPVAEFLAGRVFCILEDPKDDSQRISARELGAWVKELPSLFSPMTPSGHKRAVSISSTQGFPIAPSVHSSRRPSCRPSSRRTSLSVGVPAMNSLQPHSRQPSLRPAFEVDGAELPTVFDQDMNDQDYQDDDGSNSRSASTSKRRKRGARGGKGIATPATPAIPVYSLPPTPGSPIDHTLATLATASQSLAREISKASRSSSKHRGEPEEPPAVPPLPVMPPPVPVVVKKASKWKLSFGKNSSAEKALPSPLEELPSMDLGKPMSATASNVTNLIMGLNAPVPIVTSSQPIRNLDDPSSWSRGRQPKGVPAVPASSATSPGPRRYSPPTMYDATAFLAPQHKYPGSTTSAASRAKSPRALSPSTARSGSRPTVVVASSASSTASNNWRNSTVSNSSVATSSSAFTRYSNNSARSVSTTATSASGQSWRTQTSKSKQSSASGPKEPMQPQAIPKNIKIMDGTPWELGQMPRQQAPNLVGDPYGSPPPPRKQRVRKPKDQLDTIVERGQSPKATSVFEDAPSFGLHAEEEVIIDENGVPKKVQKGQINSLAKMLSALRR